MVRIATLLFLSALLLPACEKKGGAKPAPPPAVPAASKPLPAPAPKGVPQAFADRVAREWPAIQEAGDLFLAKFEEARKAADRGDRAALGTAVEAAEKAYQQATDGWAAIYYSADDYDDAVAEACRRFVRAKERTVSGWTKKAKALKEFSRAK